MFHSNQNPIEPEYASLSDREGFYETGNTRPPRKHGCALAALLLVCIFVSGLIGGSLLTARLLRSEPANRVEANNPDLIQTSEPTEHNPEVQTTLPVQDGSHQFVINKAPSTVPNVPVSGGLSYQEIYQKVNPSVVTISAGSPSGSVWGSGVIMSGNGYVITNCHVVQDADSLTVTLYDGQVFDASIVGKDETSDLAVLQIKAEGLTAAEFGDSDMVQVGDAVAAIGDPLGQELRGAMTDGIISAINRNLTIQGRSMTLIQTTAALNKGNSGGPLINCHGQVIGINTARVGSYYSQDTEHLVFAIPINTVKEIVDQLIQVGYVPGRPSLGVQTEEMEYQYRLFYGLPEGLYVQDVAPDSNAWSLGIREGDVITELADQEITGKADLNAILGSYEVGDQIQIVIYRRGQYLQGTLTLQDAGS